MSQKLPRNDFKWVEDISEFNEDFIKNYKDQSDEGCFSEVDVQYLENLHNLDNDLLVLLEKMALEKVGKKTQTLMNKSVNLDLSKVLA